ncbi:MAG: class II aldolase/adducin family protein [Candidatus Omnitrophota bacterium]
MMILSRAGQLKQKIIAIGKKLQDGHLVVANSGNLSARLDKNNILITATGASLGQLKPEAIIKINLRNEKDLRNNRLSTEFPVHRLIYESFKTNTIIHCHPPLVNGYFSVCSELKNLTFESQVYLGDLGVVLQETPSITKPELVIEALKANNLVVIKNHGVVSIGQNFKESFDLIETLEEAVKVASVARLFDKAVLDDLDIALKQDLTQKTNVYKMFSREHIEAIVDLINKDEFISKKGQELDLTLELAISLNEDNKSYRFIFEKGKIKKLEFDHNAPFIISASEDIWELVFLGKLDPFVAVTQGKMKLNGQLGQLSRWYVPFKRLFELFKQVKTK